ncbi:RNA methyltransferase tRNA(m5U54)methyltransferase [Elasticomyces elasticus]|nr:RNA methyltransferase tRNA(m5U54)methyltransferase [Elasticomyces elasticus]KAK4966871.1 RNA methyltransferase tRNA(m5U54)methyltransferase [Elasticomyces elasticus]
MATQQTASLHDAPATDQLVQHDGKTYQTIREGKAYILIPPNTRTSQNPQAKPKAGEQSPHIALRGAATSTGLTLSNADDSQDVPQGVFYNPIQQFNRDLSVLAIKAFGEQLCEKRRVQHKKDNGKQLAKKERKRQRKSEVNGEKAQAVSRTDVEPRAEEEDNGVMEVDEAGAQAVDGTVEHPQTEDKSGDAELRQIGLKRKAETQGAVEGDADRAVKVRRADDGSALKVVGEATENEATVAATEDIIAKGAPVQARADAEKPDEEIERSGKIAEPAHEPAEQSNRVSEQAASITDNTTHQVPSSTNGQTQPWKPKFRILDALSATGLRALRYAAEIPFATAVTANDMDKNAVKSIRAHIEHNRLEKTITANHANAIGHMYGVAYPPTDSHGPHHISGKYDVIDLDPYGTAAPFVDSALQALNDGGLLCVTCTDSGVLASCGYAEKTYSLYGGMPIKGGHSHEGGLRLVISSVASAAAKYGLAIEPLLSLSIDFYVRVFIRVTKSPADVKFLAGKTMLVYGCDAGCGAWHTQMLGRNTRQTGKDGKGPHNSSNFLFKHGIAQAPSADRLCEHCNSKMHVAGPMWAGPLHNAAFIEKVLEDAGAADKEIYQTIPRVEGMLDTALHELEVVPEAYNAGSSKNSTSELLPKTPPETVDAHPFFFLPSALAKVIHCIAPPEAAVKGALRHAGYRATRSHCKPGSIKTDAPWSVVWEVMREWVRQKHPIKDGALKEGQAGWKIMQAARKIKEATHDDGVAGERVEAATEAVMNGASTAQKPVEPKSIKVVFDEVLGKDKPGKKLVRYQANPRENWGPMTRAKGSS